MQPETKTKLGLSRWLEWQGCRVFWEKENEHGYATFAVSGANGDKPDLLVKTNRLGYVALEVKNFQSNSNVYDANPQTLRYWRQLPRVTYHTKNSQPDISGVFTATDGSPNGRLYRNETDEIQHIGDARQVAIDRGELPFVEYPMTEQYIRLLWRYAKLTDEPPNAKIGGLLSTKLDPQNKRDWRAAVLWTNGQDHDWTKL